MIKGREFKTNVLNACGDEVQVIMNQSQIIEKKAKVSTVIIIFKNVVWKTNLE